VPEPLILWANIAVDVFAMMAKVKIIYLMFLGFLNLRQKYGGNIK